MKGRSLEEIDELFENRLSVRDFPKYRTKIQEKAVHDVKVSFGISREKSRVVSHIEKVEAHIDVV
jgi:hypothetical protein